MPWTTSCCRTPTASGWRRNPAPARSSEPAKLGPPEPYLAATAVGEQRPYGADGITAGNLPWYQGRVYQADYNQDGRDDLVFWNEDRFDVHFQSEGGQFALLATPFVAEVPFDTDGGYSLMFEYTDENLFGLLSGLRKKTQLTMLHALNDMNGDGVADLVTQGLEGRSLGNHRSTYRVYFGAATAEGIAFPPAPRRLGSATGPRRGAASGGLFQGDAARFRWRWSHRHAVRRRRRGPRRHVAGDHRPLGGAQCGAVSNGGRQLPAQALRQAARAPAALSGRRGRVLPRRCWSATCMAMAMPI